MFKQLLFSTCFLLITGSLFANTGRYRLMFNSDPATEITIGWEQISGTNQKVYFDTLDHGVNRFQYADSIAPYRSTNYMSMDNQFAILTNLSPDTKYYFLIGDSEGVSARYWFRTCPDDGVSPLSFISGGDSRSGYTQRIRANKMVAKIRPHAVLFGGDLTDIPGDQSTQDWLDHWQETITSDGQMIPVVHSFGNHEATGAQGSANYIRDLFDTPAGTYYNVTFGGDLFSVYTLNGEVMPGNMLSDPVTRQDQLTWLTNTLPTDNATWKSAQYHRPMLPHNSSKVPGYNEFNDWAHLFYDNGVRLVMESDAHVVKVSMESRPNQILSATPNNEDTWYSTNNVEVNKGITFIGEGSWGTLRTDDTGYDNTLASGSFYQFNWVVVTPCQILIRSVDTQNPDNVPEHAAGDYFSISPELDAVLWKPQESDNGVFEINKCATPFAAFSVDEDTVCSGVTVNFENQSLNDPTGFVWNFGDGDTSILANPSHTYQNAGTYNVQLIASNANGSDTLMIRQFVLVEQSPDLQVSQDTTICLGETVEIVAANAINYSWNNGLVDADTHQVSPIDTTVYVVTGTSGNCSATDSIQINIDTPPTITVSNDTLICAGESIIISASGANEYTWNNGLGSGDTFTVQPTDSTIYTVTVDTGACVVTSDITVNVQPSPELIGSVDTSICAGSSITITVTGAEDYVWDNGLSSDDTHVVSPLVSTTYTVIGSNDECSSTLSFTVDVHELPTVILEAFQEESICIGNGAVPLPAGTPIGGTYSGLGVNGLEFDPQISGTGSHEVTYTFATLEGCSGDASSSIFVDECLYITENDIQIFSIYPNPTDRAFTVNSETNQVGAWIKVMDANGKVVFEQTISDFPLTVDVEAWARGTYFVEVGNANKTYPTQKIVLQ